MREAEIQAIRTAVAFSAEPATVCLRVSGDDALATLDRAVAADLFVRDGQVRPSVMLDEQGRVIADVYVGQDDEAYLLIAEGMAADDLTSHLRQAAPDKASLHVEDLTASSDTLSVHGPYAWELIGELLGPDLIGLPYLYFYRTEGILCLRGGKTGEYGYDLFIPKEQTAEIRQRLSEKGAAFDLVEVGGEALAQCSLENGFFDVRREGRAGLTPVELGLQWRVSYRKEYIGAEALSSLRAGGPARRVTYVISEASIAEGDRVLYGGAQIGHLLSTGYCPIAQKHVGIALLDRPYYHAGIDLFTAGNEGAKVQTVSPPVLVNRSLYINPQRHAYATRERDKFPPLV